MGRLAHRRATLLLLALALALVAFGPAPAAAAIPRIIHVSGEWAVGVRVGSRRVSCLAAAGTERLCSHTCRWRGAPLPVHLSTCYPLTPSAPLCGVAHALPQPLSASTLGELLPAASGAPTPARAPHRQPLAAVRARARAVVNCIAAAAGARSPRRRRGQRAMRAAANEPTSSFKLYWIRSCEVGAAAGGCTRATPGVAAVVCVPWGPLGSIKPAAARRLGNQQHRTQACTHAVKAMLRRAPRPPPLARPGAAAQTHHPGWEVRANRHAERAAAALAAAALTLCSSLRSRGPEPTI
jgi:hypothetical protein